MIPRTDLTRPNRRTFLLGAGATVVGLMTATTRRAAALDGPITLPPIVTRLVTDMAGPGEYYFGDLWMDLPIVAESGWSVPATFRVNGDITERNYVRRIIAFAPENPEYIVADYFLGPRAGKAEISTRVRVARQQTMYAVALMSNGFRWATSVELNVTSGACVEEFQAFELREFLKVQRRRGLE